MNIQQVVANEQLLYREEIAIVAGEIKRLGIRPDSETRIYPLEFGWYATVLVGVCVFIFTWHIDRITLDIHPFSGFWPNGGLIHERD